MFQFIISPAFVKILALIGSLVTGGAMVWGGDKATGVGIILASLSSLSAVTLPGATAPVLATPVAAEPARYERAGSYAEA